MNEFNATTIGYTIINFGKGLQFLTHWLSSYSYYRHRSGREMLNSAVINWQKINTMNYICESLMIYS